MSEHESLEKSINSCVLDGRCAIHDVEIERRRTDREELNKLKDSFKVNEQECQAKVGVIHDRITAMGKELSLAISHNGNLITGVFLSLGLMGVILFGSFYYTNIVDKRNDRGEEILLNKINEDYRASKKERDVINAQIIALLQSSAEQKEWQKGVIRQLELMNANLNRNFNTTRVQGSNGYYGEDQK
jgi:hypothetical protein